MEKCKTVPWKQWMWLDWSFLKADLNFNGNFLGFTNPRSVTKEEVDEWGKSIGKGPEAKAHRVG